MSEVLEQLRELMKNLGETDYSLQNKAHISQSTIYRILEGKTSDPGVHKIDGLARAMGHRLSLIPLSNAQQQIDFAHDPETLSQTIELIEALAENRGFSLNPREKAELIIAEYQQKATAKPVGKTTLKAVND